MKPPTLSSKVYTKEELCLIDQVPEPCAIVIFGASGDLTHRKLLPSLFHLMEHNMMPKNFYIVGVARTKQTEDAFRDTIRGSLKGNKAKIEEFVKRCFYVAGEYDKSDLYSELLQYLTELDEKFNVNERRVYYLSTPPSLYEKIVDRLGNSGLAWPKDRKGSGWVRVVIEKPFGHSLASAQHLNKEISKILLEDQIYRIDHYLGKETVQNILMFRFANIMFDPVWNRNYIDHVRITAAEQIGVEHRAGYYEQSGVLRDMFQNHLLQLMSLIAMEPPSSLEANLVRSRRTDVLRSMSTLKFHEVEEKSVLGQYGPGTVDGKPVIGYRQEEGVNPASRIPTFAAVKFEIDNWRWQGVPFFIRCGKRLIEREVEIAVQFKRVPTSIFKPLEAAQLTPNVLKFRIQPDEGISMRFEAKHPGPKLCMSTVTMDFGYQETFKTPPPESYARLFQDAMLGDQTLFTRSDGVEESWRIMDPIIEHWENKENFEIPIYPAGSWGPDCSRHLLEKTGHSWD